MASEAEIIYETKRALLEWGIDKKRNKEHHDFHTAIIQRSLECFRLGNKTALTTVEQAGDKQKRNDFPKDFKSAIRHVFTAELLDQIKDCVFAYDSLPDYNESTQKAIAFYPPYTTSYDPKWKERTKSPNYKINTFLKPEYKSFTQEDLDPLYRFTTNPTTPEEYYYEKFNDEGYILGTAYEGIVASHAIFNEACISCKMRKSLRWNGGSASSWKDLSCIYCGSTYEVKSKASPQKVSLLLDVYDWIYGGSFYRYHDTRCTRLVRQKDSQSNEEQQKHYIVLVSRQTTVIKSSEEVWPVHIAEIDTVSPCLTYRSFTSFSSSSSPSGGHLRISSKVKTKKSTRQHWFNIPVSTCDYFGIAREVYEEFFPGVWDRLVQQQEEEETGIVHENDKKSEEQNSETAASTVEDLRSELEKLKAGESDDDWENCYDSD